MKCPDLINPKKSNKETSMRYFPMIFAAGLLGADYLRVPAQPTPPCPRSHWIVPLSRTRQSKRLPTTTDMPGDIIAVTITVMAITMATTGHIMAMATADPTTFMVRWLWLWASLALLRQEQVGKSPARVESLAQWNLSGRSMLSTRIPSMAQHAITYSPMSFALTQNER